MNAIDRKRLFEACGLPSVIPPEFHRVFESVPIPDHSGNTLFVGTVQVMQSAEQGRYSCHRVYVTCPLCNSDEPFGRMHQHYDSGRCHHIALLRQFEIVDLRNGPITYGASDKTGCIVMTVSASSISIMRFGPRGSYKSELILQIDCEDTRLLGMFPEMWIDRVLGSDSASGRDRKIARLLATGVRALPNYEIVLGYGGLVPDVEWLRSVSLIRK